MQNKAGFYTGVTVDYAAPERAVEFLDFFDDGKELFRLGIGGVHYSRGANGEIVYNSQERLKDGFSPDGWAHYMAWGALFWPLEQNYIPVTDPAYSAAPSPPCSPPRRKSP